MPANPLTLSERVEIRAGIVREDNDHVIAEAIGRHRCSVNAEINRNGGRLEYCPVDAQARAERARERPKVPRLVADRELAAYVTARLQAKDSPMTISIELARGVWKVVAKISHETIYRAIYTSGWGLERCLHRCLHLGRRRPKRRNTDAVTSTHSLGLFNPISARPPIAAERVEVGHLEGDLIVGAYNQSALITVFDRMSRKLWMAQPANKTADAVAQALTETLQTIPPNLRRTLTWDQGSEMARWPEISAATGFDIYIADPKSPWQRPTNENGNALIRRYVGKGTNLNTHTATDLATIEHRINTIPRRIHNWATANNTYTQAVAMTD